MEKECGTSSDCVGIFNDSAIRYCFEESRFSDKEFFCDCSPWYGWKGDLCNEESFQLYWFRFIVILMIFLGTLAIIFLCFVAFKQIRFAIISKTSLSIKFYTCLSFLLASICFIINPSVQLPSLFDPDRFVIVDYKVPEFEDVTVNGGKEVSYIIFLGPTALLFGILCIVLTWFNILKRTAAWFPEVFGKKERVLERSLKILVLVYVILNVFIFVFDALLVGITLLVVLTILTAILFRYSTVAFLSKIDKNLVDSKNNVVVKRIKEAYKVVFTSLILGVGFNFVFSLLSPFQYYLLKVGGFNFIVLFRDLTVFTGISLCLYMAKYLNTLINELETKYHLSKVTKRTSTLNRQSTNRVT